MKNILLIVVTFSFFYSYAQTWEKRILNDEISISFPIAPEYKIVGNKEAYLCKVSGCAFMVGVAPKAFENYDSYLKLHETERISVIDSFLDEIVRGKLSYGNQYLISLKTIQSGKHIGKEMIYSTAELSDPDSRKRFTTLLLIKDTLYTFECWYIDSQPHDKERERFFSSIMIKD